MSQFGAIVYNTKNAGSLAPGAANNGLSVSAGVVQWGGPLGGATAAKLLNNREVPFNTFAMVWTGFDANSRLAIKENNAGQNNNLHILGQDVTAAEIFRLNWSGDVAGDHGTVFMGGYAGQNIANGTASGVVIGWKALQTATTISHATIVGYEAAQHSTTADFISAFGSNALNSMTTGGGHAAFGTSSLFGVTTGTNNSCFGEASGLGFVTSASFNVGIGANAANWSGAVGTGPSGCVIIGSGCFQTNNQYPVSGTIAIGQNIGNQNFAVGTNSIFIGTAIVLNGNTTNTTVLGAGITIGINNVVVLGRADQNIILGTTTGIADNGCQLQVPGSYSSGIRSTAVNTAINLKTDSTLILTAGGLTITNTAPTTGTGQEFLIVNQAAASTFSVNYINFAGASVNTIAANAAIGIQWNGTNWQRVI